MTNGSDKTGLGRGQHGASPASAAGERKQCGAEWQTPQHYRKSQDAIGHPRVILICAGDGKQCHRSQVSPLSNGPKAWLRSTNLHIYSS